MGDGGIDQQRARMWLDLADLGGKGDGLAQGCGAWLSCCAEAGERTQRIDVEGKPALARCPRKGGQRCDHMMGRFNCRKPGRHIQRGKVEVHA